MTNDTDIPRPRTMAARLGGDLLLSLGVVTAVAVVVLAPAWVSEAAPERARAPTMTLLRDGKIGDRLAELDANGEGANATERPLTPAALAMPMTVAWPEEGDWTTSSRTKFQQADLSATTGSVSLPPRRIAALSEKKASAGAAPLAILPPVSSARIESMQTAELVERERGASPLQSYLVSPAMKVVDVVSGAAGSIQAAGSWTLNQASGLLPRW